MQLCHRHGGERSPAVAGTAPGDISLSMPQGATQRLQQAVHMLIGAHILPLLLGVPPLAGPRSASRRGPRSVPQTAIGVIVRGHGATEKPPSVAPPPGLGLFA